MRYIKYVFLLFLFLGCNKSNEKHIAMGTWSRCNEFGVYWEYKITDNYIVVLTSELDDVWIFKNQIIDSNMIWSEYENGNKLITNNDTILTLSNSKNNIVLRGKNSWTTWEFNKADHNVDPIDSTNLKSWKDKTLLEFNKRAIAYKCPSKPIPELNMDGELD